MDSTTNTPEEQQESATEATSRPLISETSTTKDLSAYFYALRVDGAIKEARAMQSYQKHSKSLITQLHADLPNIITCLQMMESRLVAMGAIMEQQRAQISAMVKADELITKIIAETPDYDIQFVAKSHQ